VSGLQPESPERFSRCRESPEARPWSSRSSRLRSFNRTRMVANEAWAGRAESKPDWEAISRMGARPSGCGHRLPAVCCWYGETMIARRGLAMSGACTRMASSSSASCRGPKTATSTATGSSARRMRVRGRSAIRTPASSSGWDIRIATAFCATRPPILGLPSAIDGSFHSSSCCQLHVGTFFHAALLRDRPAPFWHLVRVPQRERLRRHEP
jgi:hypothetical protein